MPTNIDVTTVLCSPMTVDWWATPTIHWLLFASAANSPVTIVPWLKFNIQKIKVRISNTLEIYFFEDYP